MSGIVSAQHHQDRESRFCGYKNAQRLNKGRTRFGSWCYSLVVGHAGVARKRWERSELMLARKRDSCNWAFDGRTGRGYLSSPKMRDVLGTVQRLAGTKVESTSMCKIHSVIKSIALLLILQEYGHRRGNSHDVQRVSARTRQCQIPEVYLVKR